MHAHFARAMYRQVSFGGRILSLLFVIITSNKKASHNDFCFHHNLPDLQAALVVENLQVSKSLEVTERGCHCGAAAAANPSAARKPSWRAKFSTTSNVFKAPMV